MPQDAIDYAGICNKGNDAHTNGATAQERIRLKNFLVLTLSYLDHAKIYPFFSKCIIWRRQSPNLIYTIFGLF